jgi:hypothetical protein
VHSRRPAALEPSPDRVRRGLTYTRYIYTRYIGRSKTARAHGRDEADFKLIWPHLDDRLRG